MTVELWTQGLSHPSVAARTAVRAEAAGWDGMFVVDSQNLTGDPFVGLALAAMETSTLKLGTGVSNPATRHPAAAAAGIASVHVASGGRAVFGVGDSALAHLGLAPAPLDHFEKFVWATRAYLNRQPVAFEDLAPFAAANAPTIDSLGLADYPEDSRLHWLPEDLAAVPVEVVATGPKAIAVAARTADRVLLAVGADPERVSWAVDLARAEGATNIGAFVNVVAHDDLDLARSLAAGPMTTFARFSVMDGKVRSPIDDTSKDVLANVHGAYDMHRHTRAGSPQAAQLTPEFVDRFGIVGPAGHCVARLQELVALGIDKLIVTPPSAEADQGGAREAMRTFAAEVLPAVRS
jgi:5,10-methylenetetrahydromethanopterin reductase